MNPVPNANEATDRPPKPRRRIRYHRLAGICIGVFVLGMVFIQWTKPWLNASERRMLGVWTWQDTSDMGRCHFRDDGTVLYTSGPSYPNAKFKRWSVDVNVISLDDFEPNPLKYIVKNVFPRRKQKPDQYPVTLNADGSITFELPDGTVKVLIPWSSDQGEFPEQSE